MVPFDVHGLGQFLREQRRQAKLSLRQLAEAAEVSNPYLSQIERGLRKPSAEILQQIAKGLKISAETLYIRAGILDEEAREEQTAAQAGVEAAVFADPVLTEEQKQALLQIYASFRRESGAVPESKVAPESGATPEQQAGTSHRADPGLRKTKQTNDPEQRAPETR